MDPHPPFPAGLSTAGPWLRRLARELVRDPGTAEDALQETRLAALAHPERAGSRSWLATVLRNAVRQRFRARARRAAHEARAAAPAAAAPADEVLARLEVGERVVAAVRALDEPYRTAIALRFLEDLPPREVARRLGVPVRTVHGRVERGLARLRATLDEAYLERGAWVPLVLPLARPRVARPAGGAAGLTGGLVVGATAKWIAAGSCVLVLAAGWRLVARGEEARPLATPPRDGGAALATPPGTRTAGGSATRVAVAAGADAEPAPAAVAAGAAGAAEPAATFEGLVVDLAGRPVAGVEVVADVPTHDALESRLPDRRARTDPDGRFTMALPPPRPTVLRVRDETWASVVSPGLEFPPPEPPVVVVAPARVVAGRVTDGAGAPLDRVRLAVVVPEDVRARFPGVKAIGALAVGASLADGSFDLGRVARLEGAVLEASLPGHATLALVIPWESSAELAPVLAGGTADALSGTVVDAGGAPVAGAWVACGGRTARAGEAGRFVLAGVPASEGELEVVAVAPGLLPGRARLDGSDPAARRDVLLVVQGEPRGVAGSVVDAAGRPVAGAQVWTYDGEPFGRDESRAGEVGLVEDLVLEDLMAGGPGGRSTRSDAAGRFELHHLAARDYSVHALHPVTLEVARQDGVAAGSSGVRLVLGGREPAARVAGRVTRRDGSPVAGARVRAWRDVPTRDGGTTFRAPDWTWGAETADDGSYAFPALAVRGTRLYVNAEGLPVPTSRVLDGEPDLARVDFVVPEPCHVRVRLAGDPGRADTVRLLRADGSPVNLAYQAESERRGAIELRLVGGETPLFTADDGAVALELEKAGAVVLRLPIELRPGEVNEIEP